MGINSVKCALRGSNGIIPKTPETPANVPTLVPRAPRKRLIVYGELALPMPELMNPASTLHFGMAMSET
jgi:hypothetical protein